MAYKLDTIINRPERYRVGGRKENLFMEVYQLSAVVDKAYMEAWGKGKYWQDKEGNLHRFTPRKHRKVVIK
jgi:hypothetical protein